MATLHNFTVVAFYTVGVVAMPPTVKVGDTVIFAVTATNSDRMVGCLKPNYGGDPGPSAPAFVQGCAYAACLASYGPWDPIPVTPDNRTLTFQHTFTTAGTYSVSFTAQTRQRCDPDVDPWAGTATGKVTVVVTQ